MIGAGGVGLNAVQGARIAGARRIVAVDLVGSKLEDARVFGATDGRARFPSRDPGAPRRRRWAAARTPCSSSVGAPRAYDEAPRYLAPGGRVVAVGMPPSGATSTMEPVILAAAGQGVIGSRMGDRGPRPRHPVDGRSLVAGPA